jgi:hypothetical protein
VVIRAAVGHLTDPVRQLHDRSIHPDYFHWNGETMTDTAMRLAIIIGSTRRGRYGPAVATWFEKQAREHGGFEIDVIDLADVDLPPVLVGDGDPVPPSVLELGSRLAAADAFVPITPSTTTATRRR